MSVNTYNPDTVTHEIAATESAQRHLLQQIEQSGSPHLRLGVKESGCNGYMYTLDYIDAPDQDDLTITLGPELNVYVAPSELALINGTEIDYVTEGLNSTLQFKNAYADSYCGCRESFSVPN